MFNRKGFSKVALIIIALILIGGAYFVFSKRDKNFQQKELNESGWKLYQNKIQGYEFWYPEKLNLKKHGNQIRLSHSVPFPFSYTDECDVSGLPKDDEKYFEDFNISFELIKRSNLDVYDRNYQDSVVKELFDNDFKLNASAENYGFYEGIVKIGSLSGFHFLIGGQGCGKSVYFFPLEQNNLLKISRSILSEEVTTQETFKKIDDVITKQDEEKILNEIVSKFKLTESLRPISVKVLSPNGAEKWETGEKHTIKWETDNYDPQGEVEIFLVNDLLFGKIGEYNFKVKIATTKNTGFYEWAIPSTLEHGIGRLRGNSFKIEILLSEALVDDESDRQFIIEEGLEPPLALISPIAGGELVKGNTYLIKWTSTLPTDTIIDIMLRKKIIKSGRDYSRLFRTQNNGFKEWLLSEDVNNGDNYVLQITAYDSNFEFLAEDTSEPFSIVDQRQDKTE